MIPFSWQRQVACLMRLIFIHPSKGGTLKQKKKKGKKRVFEQIAPVFTGSIHTL